jgi:hypothetical protein
MEFSDDDLGLSLRTAGNDEGCGERPALGGDAKATHA